MSWRDIEGSCPAVIIMQIQLSSADGGASRGYRAIAAALAVTYVES